MKLSTQRLFSWLFAIFALQYATYLIDGRLADAAIKLGCLGLAAILFRGYRLSAAHRKTLTLYALLFGSALMGSVGMSDVLGLLQWFKIAMPFLFLPMMLAWYRGGEETPEFLIQSHFIWAFLFSIQSIILFFVIYRSIDYPSHFVGLARRDFMPELSYGVLGYANAINSTQYGERIIRVQSWFLEPSLLASYLIYPLLVSFGYFQSTRKTRYLVLSLACGVCLLMTFSIAGFVGVIGAVSFLMFIRRGNPRSLWALTKALAAVLVCYLAARAYVGYAGAEYAYRDDSAVTKVVARDTQSQGKLLRSSALLGQTIDLIKSHPAGIGFGNTDRDLQVNTTTSPNAAFYWIVAGGIPAAVALILLYWDLFFNYCLPLLQSDYPPFRMIAAAFIGVSIQHLSYGTWISPIYLFVVGIMMLAAHGRRSAAEGVARHRRLPVAA